MNGAGGVGPYTYNWGFGTGATQSGLAPGLYTVTVTDTRGCISTVPVTINCILPIEMAFLEANPYNNSIRLDWATTQEVNNERFDVLRSTDGENFSKVGEVATKVGTGPGTDYAFVDDDVTTGIKYYYRLQQFDRNGASDFTNVVTATLLDGNSALVKTVYPNPFEDVVNIALALEEDTEIRIQVVNTLGQNTTVMKTFNLNAGNREMRLDMRQLPAGIYFGKLYRGGVQIGSVKLVKGK